MLTVGGYCPRVPSQLARGDAVQLLVDERQQTIERVPIAPRPIDEQW